jgi:hypothetical protein
MTFRARGGFDLHRKENIGLDKTKEKKRNIKEKIRKYLCFYPPSIVPPPTPGAHTPETGQITGIGPRIAHIDGVT